MPQPYIPPEVKSVEVLMLLLEAAVAVLALGVLAEVLAAAGVAGARGPWQFRPLSHGWNDLPAAWAPQEDAADTATCGVLLGCSIGVDGAPPPPQPPPLPPSAPPRQPPPPRSPFPQPLAVVPALPEGGMLLARIPDTDFKHGDPALLYMFPPSLPPSSPAPPGPSSTTPPLIPPPAPPPPSVAPLLPKLSLPCSRTTPPTPPGRGRMSEAGVVAEDAGLMAEDAAHSSRRAAAAALAPSLSSSGISSINLCLLYVPCVHSTRFRIPCTLHARACAHTC